MLGVIPKFFIYTDRSNSMNMNEKTTSTKSTHGAGSQEIRSACESNPGGATTYCAANNWIILHKLGTE